MSITLLDSSKAFGHQCWITEALEARLLHGLKLNQDRRRMKWSEEEQGAGEAMNIITGVCSQCEEQRPSRADKVQKRVRIGR